MIQTRQQRSYGRTREKLIDAARTVLADKGLSATTVEEIADVADVGRGSFYYHFEAKDELILQILSELLEELSEAIETACDTQTELEGVLDAIISAHIVFFKDRWKDFVLYSQSCADMLLGESVDGIEATFFVYLQSIERPLASALEQPVSKPRLRRLACALAGFISGYYAFASVATGEEDTHKAFASLRGAFVISLSQFIQEATP